MDLKGRKMEEVRVQKHPKTYFRFSNGAVTTCLRVTTYGTNAAARARLITVEIISWWRLQLPVKRRGMILYLSESEKRMFATSL